MRGGDPGRDKTKAQEHQNFSGYYLKTRATLGSLKKQDRRGQILGSMKFDSVLWAPAFVLRSPEASLRTSRRWLGLPRSYRGVKSLGPCLRGAAGLLGKTDVSHISTK